MKTETLRENVTFEGNPLKKITYRKVLLNKRIVVIWTVWFPTPDDTEYDNERMTRLSHETVGSEELKLHTLALTSMLNQCAVEYAETVTKANTPESAVLDDFERFCRGI